MLPLPAFLWGVAAGCPSTCAASDQKETLPEQDTPPKVDLKCSGPTCTVVPSICLSSGDLHGGEPLRQERTQCKVRQHDAFGRNST